MVRLAGGDWGSDSRRPRANCSRADRGRATRAECGKSVGLVAKPFTQRRREQACKGAGGCWPVEGAGQGMGQGGDQSSRSKFGRGRKRKRKREREKKVEVGEYDDNFPQMAQAVMAPRDAEGARAARDWGFDMCALQDPRPSTLVALGCSFPPHSTTGQGKTGQDRADLSK